MTSPGQEFEQGTPTGLCEMKGFEQGTPTELCEMKGFYPLQKTIMGVKRSESTGQDLCSNVSDKRMASGITGKVRGSVSLSRQPYGNTGRD